MTSLVVVANQFSPGSEDLPMAIRGYLMVWAAVLRLVELGCVRVKGLTVRANTIARCSWLFVRVASHRRRPIPTGRGVFKSWVQARGTKGNRRLKPVVYELVLARVCSYVSLSYFFFTS